MSIAELERCAADMAHKDGLRAEMQAFASNPGSATLDRMVGIGARHGYDFSADEVMTFARERLPAGGGELTDQDLERVAGGIAPVFVVGGLVLVAAIAAAAVVGAAYITTAAMKMANKL